MVEEAGELVGAGEDSIEEAGMVGRSVERAVEENKRVWEGDGGEKQGAGEQDEIVAEQDNTVEDVPEGAADCRQARLEGQERDAGTKATTRRGKEWKETGGGQAEGRVGQTEGQAQLRAGAEEEPRETD